MNGEVNDIVNQYPELNKENLKVQQAGVQSRNTFKSSAEMTNIIKGTTVEARGLFNQVETLVRLLLDIPVTSAETERSFKERSALKRLKTCLRTTMTQVRLNNVAVRHVHQNKPDNTDANSSFLLKNVFDSLK